MKTKIILSFASILLLALIVISCKKTLSNPGEAANYSAEPNLPETPYNYKASTNDNLAALGRVLFYDKNLSINNSISCASCHQQEKAFCDNLQFSPGVENSNTPRNSPSIFAKNSPVFWDGRASSLNDLALRPVKNHIEMRFENLDQLVNKIAHTSYYPQLFKKAFPGVDDIDSSKIKLALAEFLKNFNFSNNKFSRSENGLESLTASEKLGKLVFFNKGRCANCHHIESNNNIGFPGNDSLIVGGGYGSTSGSHNIGLDEVYKDRGIGDRFNDSRFDGAFMVPALLNVEYTAPYMHDGRFKTLEEVVEHYNSGIKQHPNLDLELRAVDANMTELEIMNLFDKNKDGEIDEMEIANIPPVRLGLTPAEKRGLVDFLKTLTDHSILKEPKFSNPFTMK